MPENHEHCDHNHERPPFRVDVYKLKNKIFNMYQPNSPERKRLINDEKIRELEEMRAVSNAFPQDVTDSLLNSSKLHLRKCLLKVSLYSGLLSAVLITHSKALVPGNLWTDYVYGLLLGGLSYFLVSASHDLYLTVKSMRKLIKSQEAFRNRIQQLEKEIDE